MQRKTLFINALDLAGLNTLLRPIAAGRGVIFMLHRVVADDALVLMEGNAVRLSFLEQVLDFVARSVWHPIKLSEVPAWLASGRRERFVSFTFDDGYRDNLELALPLFRRYMIPLDVFLCTGYVDAAQNAMGASAEVNTGIYLLEAALKVLGEVDISVGGFECRMPVQTQEQKQRAYALIRPVGWRDAVAFAEIVSELGRAAQIAPGGVIADYFLTWDEASVLANDPLVEIGAHSITHRPLSGLEEDVAVAEIKGSRNLIEERLGVPAEVFAYPSGGRSECSWREFTMVREAKYLAAVTTRRGNIFKEHQGHLCALPRVALSMVPHAARMEFVRAALSGTRNLAMNRGRRFVVD